MAFPHFCRDLSSRQSATTLIGVVAHARAHTQGEGLWVCDVNCGGQGVSVLALATEPGSVSAHGSHFLVRWHTVCSRAGLNHRGAMAMGKMCGKANSEELFFGFWWSPAAWKYFLFCITLCTGSLANPLYLAWSFYSSYIYSCIYSPPFLLF